MPYSGTGVVRTVNYFSLGPSILYICLLTPGTWVSTSLCLDSPLSLTNERLYFERFFPSKIDSIFAPFLLYLLPDPSIFLFLRSFLLSLDSIVKRLNLYVPSVVPRILLRLGLGQLDPTPGSIRRKDITETKDLGSTMSPSCGTDINLRSPILIFTILKL